jgi:queuine/archaeosine tRNA-ribosyltransferase
MADIRAAIFEQRFAAFATAWLARYERAEGVI